MPGGGGANCLPAASCAGVASTTGGVEVWQAATASSKARAINGRIDPSSTAGGFAGLDPGLVELLGLVIRRIGAFDGMALADPDRDELLKPLLLERVARDLVGEMAWYD